ncbi:unnamed protein product [Malus baccata var. baccata]
MEGVIRRNGIRGIPMPMGLCGREHLIWLGVGSIIPRSGKGEGIKFAGDGADDRRSTDLLLFPFLETRMMVVVVVEKWWEIVHGRWRDAVPRSLETKII